MRSIPLVFLYEDGVDTDSNSRSYKELFANCNNHYSLAVCKLRYNICRDGKEGNRQSRSYME